ncbi:MAG: carbohydrate ABC transporter permease [Alkalispirochaeta sp.]
MSSVQQAPRTLSPKQQEARLGWFLVAPAILIIGGLILYPIVYNVYLSFFDVGLVGDNVLTGVRNHVRVVSDPRFWNAVWTTIIYVVFSVLGTVVVGIVVALAMNREFPLRWLVRSIILLPYVAPVIATVFAWQFFFDPVNGLFVHVLVEVLGVVQDRFNLIGNPGTAVIVAIVFSVWKNFPFAYLMILSRLQAIDETLYEAAELDGCGWWDKFRFVTLPELYFIIGSLVLLRVIWNFNKFEEVYLITDNVRVLSIYTYLTAFTGALDLGRGATLAVIQFLLLMGFILYYVKKVLKW